MSRTEGFIQLTPERRMKMGSENEEYMDIEQRKEIRNKARMWRRKFIRYKEAEYIYGIQHRKLLELADKAGALYRIDGYVLINVEIFEAYLERFHQPPKMTKTGGKEL
jgi:hypothetical protein